MQFTDQTVTEWLKIDDFTRDDLIKGIREMNSKITSYIQNDDLDKEITMQWHEDHKPVISNPRNMIFNYITHNAYHRGQLALLLRTIGIPEIKETDFNPYLYELGQK